MDIDTVRAILCDLDTISYHQASEQKATTDDVWPAQLEDLTEERASGNVTELVGRNDIISRYIFIKTGQFRTRKQVSSHIQVWAHCKKPPSSRDMAVADFERLQAMFRQYYSRPVPEFGQCRKRGRRVVSTSSAGRRLSRGALGIGIGIGVGAGRGASSPASAAASVPGERKREVLWGDDDSPAKRCRRVASEMPFLDLASLGDASSSSGGSSSSDAADVTPLLDPYGPYPRWSLGHGGLLLDMYAGAGSQAAASQPLLAQHTPLLARHTPLATQHTPLLAHPAMFAPAFDAPGDAATFSLGISTPVDPSVAAFAATIAAMSGFDGGASPAGDGSGAALLPHAAAKGASAAAAAAAAAAADCGGLALGLAADAISAFASAVGTIGGGAGRLSPRLSHGLAGGPACATPTSAIGADTCCSDGGGLLGGSEGLLGRISSGYAAIDPWAAAAAATTAAAAESEAADAAAGDAAAPGLRAAGSDVMLNAGGGGTACAAKRAGCGAGGRDRSDAAAGDGADAVVDWSVIFAQYMQSIG
ncbi:hypothetical protein H4R18_001722 [Coemansia javaensis]|uniref:TEA domain-containing protein n=1 Tax=Coemansia javaensis TaxID=2761396 RepID=A0A9W8HJS7_9FUNG|nr:hypothetical protein H4R18_001722 [Coemansia javaensis]